MSWLNQLESFYIIPLDGAQSIHFLLLAKIYFAKIYSIYLSINLQEINNDVSQFCWLHSLTGYLL